MCRWFNLKCLHDFGWRMLHVAEERLDHYCCMDLNQIDFTAAIACYWTDDLGNSLVQKYAAMQMYTAVIEISERTLSDWVFASY